MRVCKALVDYRIAVNGGIKQESPKSGTEVKHPKLGAQAIQWGGLVPRPGSTSCRRGFDFPSLHLINMPYHTSIVNIYLRD
jgi:hypothetical protein